MPRIGLSMTAISQSLASVWRTLRSMRTALILLLVIALASVAGSFIPQIPNSPQRVASLFAEHPALARAYDALGLFDVYGSWWFTLCYVLILISLAACLVPRTRGLVRSLRQHAQPARELEGMRHYASGTVDGPAQEALGRARKALRRRWYRVRGGAEGIAAEKGIGRDVGSLAFHWAFFLLLLGIVYGKGFGFTGQATIVEGQTWTEAHASYDFPPREGRFFRERHTGVQVRVDEFRVRYRDNGVPEEFVSRVQVVGGERADIRVNHPLQVGGVKLFQSGYGWAPVVEVRKDGAPLSSGPLVFITDEPDDLRTPWRGAIKLPGLRPQVGIELRLLPDPASALVGAPMLEARSPFLTFTAYRGDLQLTRAQSVFRLEKERLREWRSGGLGVGETVEVGDGITISFPELREYTQLFVARDPGTGITFAAAMLILAGLVPAMFSSRRRLWVRAFPDGEETRLELGGFALQRKAAFEEEFERVADAVLRRRATVESR